MPPKLKNDNECRQVVEEEMATRALSGGAIRRRLSKSSKQSFKVGKLDGGKEGGAQKGASERGTRLE